MKKHLLFLSTAILLLCSCSTNEDVQKTQITSPDKKITLNLWLQNGIPNYAVTFNDELIIDTSLLGLVLSENDTLSSGLTILEDNTSSINNTWEQVWGDQKIVTNNYESYSITFAESSGKQRSFSMEFRVFNDGIGFRYFVPEQAGLKEFTIMDELTEFNMTENHKAWWIPAYRDNRYEYLFSQSNINALDTVHTPLTIELNSGTHISIHEAALIDYAGMTIAALDEYKLKCDLAPWSDGTKVKTCTPMHSPWRTIQISPDAGGLITSKLILNLNEANKLDDTSWIKPTKYLGIWWAMHIGKYTFWENPKHGASTSHSLEYINYCKKLGIDHLLIEGWNIGWTPAWYENLLHVFSFTQSTADFNFEEVSNYASENEINLIGYHETGSNIDNYLKQIDEGMQMYHDAGMHSVKIGQVGSRLMLKEWHYGQYGVEYYQYVLNKAAEYKLSVNFHEPIKPTGLSRTYPHLMAGEGARGQEYNAWSEGNPPDHTCIIPFTRLLGGPMDFTPGIFAIEGTRVHTTLAKQLALYITVYSPIQMLADLPENYDGHPAFKFLQDVPVNWETTKVINAKIGDYLTIIRKDIDSEDWYLGSITDENEREFTVSLNFLDSERSYKAQIYADAIGAEFDINPEAYIIDEISVNSKSNITINLAKGGGQAIRFIAL